VTDGILIITPIDLSIMNIAWRNTISRNRGLDLDLRVWNIWGLIRNHKLFSHSAYATQMSIAKRHYSSQNLWLSLFRKAICRSWKKSMVFGKAGQFHTAISLCNQAMLFGFLLVCSAGFMVS